MAASETIPSKVDIIILGTGLTNSILAAACSRIGKSVLHLDKNSYYGDQWASFNLQQLLDYIRDHHPNDKSTQIQNDKFQELLAKKSRLFCIDLCPRPLFSNGSMVNLLVTSNVTRYHEFKNNIRILSLIGGNKEIHQIPCQRSDVFNSPLLSSLVDKRRLMKFVEMCLESENSEIAENAEKPIYLFLKEKGLDSTITEYLINSIAMIEPKGKTREACNKIRNFMMSTQRFGKSPFLLPIYGTGEFPQSFCRLSAVFGGIYCLNTKIDKVDIDKSQETKLFEIQLENSCKVKSDKLVVDNSYATKLSIQNSAPTSDTMARAILITDKSIKCPNLDNSTSFMRIPPSEFNENIVYLLEENSSLMVCPPEFNLVYLWTRTQSNSNANPQEVLLPIVEKLFPKEDVDPNNNHIIWQFYYYQTAASQEKLIDRIHQLQSDEVHVTSPPCDDIDYEHNIKEASKLFEFMFPNEEFLPRAPDPDEIIS